MTVKEQLIEAIDCNLAYLPEIPQGTEEQKIATDSTAKLLSELREMEKSEKDNEIKLIQMKNDNMNRMIEHGITIASSIGGAFLLTGMSFVILDFEKEGSITSKIGKMFIEGYRKFIR